MQWVIVEYYNVKFYLILKGVQDIIKFSYLKSRIESGGELYMKDIFSWCIGQRICVTTKFEYMRDIPISANLWNYYSYLRAKSEYKKLKNKCSFGYSMNKE